MFGNVNNLNTFVYPKLFKAFKAILIKEGRKYCGK